MSFIKVQMDFAGQVGVVPRVGRLFTDFQYAQLTEPGFIYQGFDGNTYSPTDVIIASYNDGNHSVSHGIFVPVFNGTQITLEDLSESGGLTPPINLMGQKNVQIAGSLTVTNNSVDVVGVGTLFTNLTQYQVIWINNEVYYVDLVTSDTAMTFTSAYTGPTASGLKAFTDDDYLTCRDSSGELVFQIGQNGEITTPLTVNNFLKGAFHQVYTSAVGLYPRPYHANGIIQLTNADPVHIAIGLLARYVDYKIGYQVEFIQVGTGFTSFFSGETDVLLFNTIDGQQPNFTQGAVCRATLISVTDGDGTWSIEIVGSGADQYNQIHTFGPGPWAASEDTTVRIVKRDNVVTMTVVGVNSPIENATSVNNITSTGDPIPEEFWPTEEIYGYAVTRNTEEQASTPGFTRVTPAGVIIISCDDDWSGEAGVTPIGFFTFTSTWIINYDEP